MIFSKLSSGNISSEFLLEWEEFLREYGHRCPAEIDAATKRPKEDPSLIFSQLKRMGRSLRKDHSSLDFFRVSITKRQEAFEFLYGEALKKGKGKAKSFVGTIVFGRL